MADAPMPWLGSHLSISGGLYKALDSAGELGMDSVQVFTRNQRQWNTPPLAEDEITAFRDGVKKLGWTGDRLVSHNSYLVNMASPDSEGWEKSVGLMRRELERCEQLGIPTCVSHPGAHLEGSRRPGDPNELGKEPDPGELNGLKRIAKAIDRLEKETSGYTVSIALENTVGSGTNLGYDFAHLGRIRELVRNPDRVGFCFDTCHAVAAGYDMSTNPKAKAAIDRLDEACGLENILALHLNDSIGAIGSRKDRHAHIGHGECSDACFRQVLAVSAWSERPMILETEKADSPDGRPWDTVNLEYLRSLIPGSKSSRRKEQPA